MGFKEVLSTGKRSLDFQRAEGLELAGSGSKTLSLGELLGVMVTCRILWHTGSQPSSVGPLWAQGLVQLNLPKTISALSLLCCVQKNNAEKRRIYLEQAETEMTKIQTYKNENDKKET